MKKINRERCGKMVHLLEGMNFDEYLEKSEENQKEALLKAYANTKLSSEAENKLRNLKAPIHVIVFSEGYCPDCTVTVPFIKRMQEVNGNLRVVFHPRRGNEALMEELTGDARIPTVVTFTEEMDPKGAYVEVPQALVEKMASVGHDRQKELISAYRQGKYNDFIEKELLHIIV
jgi:hypothetical protein